MEGNLRMQRGAQRHPPGSLTHRMLTGSHTRIITEADTAPDETWIGSPGVGLVAEGAAVTRHPAEVAETVNVFSDAEGSRQEKRGRVATLAPSLGSLNHCCTLRSDRCSQPPGGHGLIGTHEVNLYADWVVIRQEGINMA